MSGDMRPEVRRWGPPAGMFVPADAALDLLAALSQRLLEIDMSYVDEVSQDVYRVRWDDGIAILRRFEALTDPETTAAILEVERQRGVEAVPRADAQLFIQNLKASAPEWEPFLDPDDGSLELLVDA
ncbi:MAG: hypothetical protein JXB32_14790 [Deltaproteobacteria bacterium]|nr:hypothetical protein [Deltaproteobacteria bacterium]